VYTLRQEYIRKGVRDMFHVVEGILRVVYHRCFWFRDDGTLVYAMLPGALPRAFSRARFDAVSSLLALSVASPGEHAD
jgi:hypothetical protein